MGNTKLNKSINLLNPILEPEDIWTKIYNWVTQVGKYLLVLVCVIVLSVFFARFFLDKRNNDLTTEINEKVEYMLDTQEKRQEEIRFRSYQNLLTDIALLSEEQPINSVKIATVLDTLPKEFTLYSISFDENRVTMALLADNFEQISKYSSELNSNPAYKDVSVSVSKTSSTITEVDFSINFSFVE